MCLKTGREDNERASNESERSPFSSSEGHIAMRGSAQRTAAPSRSSRIVRKSSLCRRLTFAVIAADGLSGREQRLWKVTVPCLPQSREDVFTDELAGAGIEHARDEPCESRLALETCRPGQCPKGIGWEAGIRTPITWSRATRPTVERPPSADESRGQERSVYRTPAATQQPHRLSEAIGPDRQHFVIDDLLPRHGRERAPVHRLAGDAGNLQG